MTASDRRSRATRPTVYRRARHRVRSRIAESPACYLPFARRKYPGPSPEVIGADTELVIDGYTRSASTFAVYALQLAQPSPIRLAHHLHAPAQLLAAARRGIPALLVIREPRGAVLSQVVREPDVAVPDAMASYARFHERLLPYRGRLVVADFHEVTHDFGAVVDRLNSRFGLSLRRFEHTAQNVADCFDLVALRDSLSPVLLGFESGTVDARAMRAEAAALGELCFVPGEPSWAPSAERDARKDRLRAQWDSPRLDRLRRRAQCAYEALTSDAALTPGTGGTR